MEQNNPKLKNVSNNRSQPAVSTHASVMTLVAKEMETRREIDSLLQQIQISSSDGDKNALEKQTKELQRKERDLDQLVGDDGYENDLVLGETNWRRLRRASLQLAPILFFTYVAIDLIAAAEGHKWVSGSIEPFKSHLTNDLTDDMGLGKGVKYGHLYGTLLLLAVMAVAIWIYRREQKHMNETPKEEDLPDPATLVNMYTPTKDNVTPFSNVSPASTVSPASNNVSPAGSEEDEQFQVETDDETWEVFGYQKK